MAQEEVREVGGGQVSQADLGRERVFELLSKRHDEVVSLADLSQGKKLDVVGAFPKQEVIRILNEEVYEDRAQRDELVQVLATQDEVGIAAAPSAPGYQDLRDRIQANWAFLEIRNDVQAAIIRIAIGGADTRFTWTHVAGAQTLEATAVLKGSDADIGVGRIVAGSALYKVATLGDAMHPETFTAFTFNNTADQLTIKHRLQVPTV